MLNFLGIGAQKAGTTWLYEMLSKHPEIEFPGGKEMHFWSADTYEEHISDYLKLFEANNKLMGEITPAYSMLDIARVSDIHKLFPKLKIFFVMRNPIERAWSSALMALKRAELDYDEVSNQWFIDHFHSRGSLGRGDYLACLDVWQSCYSESNILLLYYDELSYDPKAFLKKCLLHIGVSDEWLDTLAEDSLNGRVFTGSGRVLPSELRSELILIYEPKIKELSRRLDVNILHWLQC